MFNFNPFVAEGRLNAPSLYSIKIVCLAIVCSACNERRLSLNYNRSETHKLKNTKGNQRILKISESLSELTENDERSTSGELTSVRSSGESEFL